MFNKFMFCALLLASILSISPAVAQDDFGYNKSVTLINSPSTWITDTLASSLQKNNEWRGANFYWNLSATGYTAVSVTFVIQGYDETSGGYYTILTDSARTVTAGTRMTVFPGCIAATNITANSPLPKLWRVVLNVPSGDSVKATVGASLIK